jgi:hypothetical protein
LNFACCDPIVYTERQEKLTIRINKDILAKIAERKISLADVEQCFMNREGGLCLDTRAEHLTDPVTRWFVAKTDKDRALKIMYVPIKDGAELKSAYDATEEVCRIYNKFAKH